MHYIPRGFGYFWHIALPLNSIAYTKFVNKYMYEVDMNFQENTPEIFLLLFKQNREMNVIGFIILNIYCRLGNFHASSLSRILYF